MIREREIIMKYIKNIETLMVVMLLIMLFLNLTESILYVIADRIVVSLIYFLIVILDAAIIYFFRKSMIEKDN